MIQWKILFFIPSLLFDLPLIFYVRLFTLPLLYVLLFRYLLIFS